MNMISKIFGSYKKNVFVSWVMSYIVILLLTTCIGSYGYYQSISIIKNEVNKAHQASLLQFQKIVDEKIKSMERTCSEINLNRRNTSLMNSETSLDPIHKITAMQLMKDINAHNVANDWIEDIFIYYKNNAFVLTSRTKYNLSEFYQFHDIFQNMSYEEFIELIDGNHNREYLTLAQTKENGEKIKQTLFIQSLPMGSRDDSLATIIITINQDKLYQMLINANWMNEGQAFIINDDNVVVAQTDAMMLPPSIQYDKLVAYNQYIDRDGESIVVSHVDSEATGWKYIFLVPKNIYLKKLLYMKNIIIITIMACLVIGTIIAYWLSKRNYRPLSRTIKSIEKIKASTKWKKEDNEYQYIEKLVKKLSDEYQDSNSQLNKQKKIMKNNYLIKLLKGKYNLQDQEIEQLKKKLDINFLFENFTVVAFRVEEYISVDTEVDLNNGSFNKIALTLFVIKNVVEELLTIQQHQQCYVIEVDEMLIAIIDFGRSEERSLRIDLLQRIQEAKEFFENKMGIYLTMGISGIHKEAIHISDAYKQALEAIEYRILVGDKRIIEYDKIEYGEDAVHACYDFILDEQKFINAIKVNDFKSAKQVLDTIFKNNFVRSIPIELAKRRMMSIVDLMTHAVQELDLGDKQDGSKQVDIDKQQQIDLLLQCQTVNQLQQEMNRILIQIDESLQNYKELNEHSVLKRIKAFIKKEYSNFDMNVGFVADEFQMDATYLSRVMKKDIGKSMLEFIHDVRLSEAKKLIQETDLSIKEIGEKVGYINPQTFIRVFKKYEGITPGKYKELHSEGK